MPENFNLKVNRIGPFSVLVRLKTRIFAVSLIGSASFGFKDPLKLASLRFP